jgi:hypothetical protein
MWQGFSAFPQKPSEGLLMEQRLNNLIHLGAIEGWGGRTG